MQRNPLKPGAALALLVLVAVIATPAHASTVRRLELDELRAKAESVFAGEVVGMSQRLGNNGQMVWTDYEIEVSDHLAGRNPGPRTRVSFAGGTLPELSIGVPGVPKLREGDHYVFFLAPKLDSPTALLAMPTVGWGQGLYRLSRIDSADGARTALVSADGEPLEISSDGRLSRGTLVRIVDGRVVEPETPVRDGAGSRVRPSFVESPDGTVRPFSPSPSQPEVVVRTARTFATLDDVRLFAQGRLAAVTVRNR